MVPEQVFERFVPDMRAPSFASQIIARPALLQPTGAPAIQRWVRGCVDGYLSRPPGRSQGSEGVFDM